MSRHNKRSLQLEDDKKQSIENTNKKIKLISIFNDLLFKLVNLGELDNVVKVLSISKDIDINERNKEGSTLLFIAVKENKPKIVKFLLQQKNINPNKGWQCPDRDYRDAPYWTMSPLNEAIIKDYKEIFRLLITHERIDINQYSEDYTPLHNAVICNNHEFIKSLATHPHIDLELGSAPDGHYMRPPVGFAIMNNNKEVVELLLHISPPLSYIGEDLLLVAIWENNDFEMFKLISHWENTWNDIDINSTIGYEDGSYLYNAINKNRPKIVELLLQREDIKVDEDEYIEDRYIPFDAAIANGNIEIIKLLLDFKNKKGNCVIDCKKELIKLIKKIQK
jgi:ankyrin repeat protein